MNKEKRLSLICRLCGKEEKYVIDIFSENGRKQELEKKIRLCLPITVTVDDEMPRQVCLDCLNKLDAAFDLYTGCIEAQYYIREKLFNMSGPVSVASHNGTLQSGFVCSSNSIHSKNPAIDSSLRNVLGLQRTFSSFVDVEQKRLDEENMHRLVGSQKGIVQPPGLQFTDSSTQYMNNMPAQVNPSTTTGHVLRTQLEGTSIMIGAPNVPMMEAVNSPITGNLHAKLFVPTHSNSSNSPVSVAAVPVMASPRSMQGPSTQMTMACSQPQYPTQNNLPSSLHIMPVLQVQSRPSGRNTAHFASASSISQARPSSMPQNGVPLSQTSKQQQWHVGSLMQQTSTWNKSPGSNQPLGAAQITAVPDLSAAKTAQENGPGAVPPQPMITQVTSGYQDPGADRPVQESTAHLDLSNDTDDDMDTEDTRPDAVDTDHSDSLKPLPWSEATVPQKKMSRKRGGNPLAMEMCPHCQKEFRGDIIFHHIKLHYRKMIFSCLDCGKNYCTEKALVTHNCPGEVANA